MRMRRCQLISTAMCLLATVVICTTAHASGLQVSPITLSLQPAQSADGLWLSNTGNNSLHAQVRVYRWSQQGGEEQLTPSRDLLISPPILEIKAGDRQLVRVIRTIAPPNGDGAVEGAYRLAIDELPVDMQGKPGLQFVLHYSVPIFVEPANTASVTPALHWQLLREGDQAVLEVANSGNGHAQLSELMFTDRAGKHVVVSEGLLGYVLPGATMHWTLKRPASDFNGGGTLEASINGTKATQDVTLADRSR